MIASPPSGALPPVSNNGRSQDIEDLVQRLPHDAAMSLYREIEQEPSTPNRSVVHRALVDHLNGARRLHARRQFTQLFEPYLCRHTWLLREEYAAPGVIHVLDIGGLWAVLASKPLAVLAREADLALTDMARSQPLAIALNLPDALALRERLRQAAVDSLKPRLQDRNATRDMLEAMNAWRRADVAEKGWGFQPRPLTLADLTLYLAILEAGHRYTALLTTPADHDGGEEALAALMDYDPPGIPADIKAKLSALVPLVRLNQKRAYNQLVPALVQGPTSWQPDLQTAMVRHLAYICHTIGDGLAQLAWGPGGPPAGANPPPPSARRPLTVPPDRQSQLERELAGLDTLLSLLEEFDMLRDGRDANAARNALDDMIRKVETTLYPYLTGRVSTVTQGVGRALADETALVWALGYILRLRTYLTRNLHWGTRFSEFRDRLVEDLGDTFKAAYTDGFAAADARERLAHAGQAAKLAGAIGADLPGTLTLLDSGVVSVTLERLNDPTPLGADEGLLVATVARLAESEIKRTRHWKDPALASVVELAGQRAL